MIGDLEGKAFEFLGKQTSREKTALDQKKEGRFLPLLNLSIFPLESFRYKRGRPGRYRVAILSIQ